VAYAELSVFNQLCQRHRRAATSITFDFESEDCFTDVFGEFLQDIWKKVPTSRPKEPKQPVKAIENLEDEEESKNSEERLLESMMAYEEQLKKNSEKAERIQIGSGFKRTKGKHVSSLCQACKSGVCSYFNMMTKFK